MSAEPPAAAGSFAPLRQPLFAVLWAATVLGNVGSFMRDVASGWMITELSASPTAVALIQTAATLPIFALAIPAGVLSDLLDRRRFLIAVQLLLAGVSAVLLWGALHQQLSVNGLLALTLIGGIGTALGGPTWQSIVPELVARPQLRAAVALNSLGFNISRALGPAAGGALVAAFGAAAAYAADVLSYAVVIGALLWWRRAPRTDGTLPEPFVGAFRAGLRYARASREMHVLLLKAAAFLVFASAVWALLPLVARRLLGGDAGFYGLLLGAVGGGAVMGALLLPRLRARLAGDGLLLLASVGVGAVTAALATAPRQGVALALALLLGAGWIVALTTLNSVTQAILPNWVRGRGLAIYLMVFNGCMAGGSLLWGLAAQVLGLPVALGVAAAGLPLGALLLYRLRLPPGEADLQPARHWPEPASSEPVAHHRGPVMVQVEYRIRAADRAAFLQAMRPLARARRRDGAHAWGLVEDTQDPERLVEWFLVESWAEHLRQHQRVSRADADVQAAAVRVHAGDQPPRVSHLLTVLPP